MATATRSFTPPREADELDEPDGENSASSVPSLAEVRTAALRPVLTTATFALLLAAVVQFALGSVSYAAGAAVVGIVHLIVFGATRAKSTFPDLAAYGAQVVGEGIETDGELECLVELGCDLGQGYRLGRPDTPARMLDL